MIQPVTLTEQEAAGGQKIGTYFGCDVSKFPAAPADLTKQTMEFCC
jgi:hypothetical protein